MNELDNLICKICRLSPSIVLLLFDTYLFRMYCILKYSLVLSVFGFSVFSIISCAIEEYTVKEKNAIRNFRPLVADLLYRDFMHQDEFLIRWLRARSLNLELAKQMLKNAVEWRKANKVDTILDEDFSDFEREFPLFYDSRDKQGRPVLLILAGQYNIRKAVLAGKRDLLNRYLDRNYELGQTIARKANVTQGFVIVDLYGLNARTHACLQCIPVFVHFTLSLENYYPQLAQKFFVVNTPEIYKVIQQVTDPLLSNYTVIEIYGHNKDEWSKKLLDVIDADQLPVRYGGTKVLSLSQANSLGKS